MGAIHFTVSTHGAELLSLQADGREFIWQGDPLFWGRHAPILFPLVGKVWGGAFRVDGREYPMGQHGFARDSEFSFDGDRYVLGGCLPEKYPYRFELSVRYRVQGRKLLAEWVVRNCDERWMHFQIGAHPALLLPDYRPEDRVHGYLQCFDGNGRAVAQPLMHHSLDEGFLTPLEPPVPMPMEDGLLPLTDDTFAVDTYMIEHSQVKSVTLLDKCRRPYLSVGSNQAQAYGLWAPHKPGCPFVCLEPWCGINDTVGFGGELSERYMNNPLAPGETFEFTYWIEIY